MMLNKQNKGFGQPKPKTNPSDRVQISLYVKYLRSSLAQLQCPKQAIDSYAKYTVRRLRYEGFGFLKKSRNLFIQGVKILGGDKTDFSGFSRKNELPRYLYWVFSELKKQSTLGANFSQRRSQLLLSILYLPKSIKLRSKSAEKIEISRFIERVTAARPSTSIEVINQPYRLYKQFESVRLPKTDLVFVAHEQSQKRSDFGYDIPKSVDLATQPFTKWGDPYEPNKFPKYHELNSIPYGTVKLLTECGGKHRVICSYASHIHSNNVRHHLRSILDSLPQDSSKDQATGHIYAQKLSAGKYSTSAVSCGINVIVSSVPLQCKPSRTKNIFKAIDERLKRFFVTPAIEYEKFTRNEQTVKRSRLYPIVSADLSAFTDNIDPGAYMRMCHSLGIPEFRHLYTTPVKVNNDVIKPNVPLMGLKGCFDIASLIHHCLVQEFITLDYRVCGDDFVGRCDLHSYENALATVGLSLNRSKTLVSETTSVFCGKVYHFGRDISPTKPPLHVLVTGTFTDFKSAVESYLPKVFGLLRREFIRISLNLLGRFKRFISLDLPFLLDGIPLKRSGSSLISVLNHKRNKLIASAVIYSWLNTDNTRPWSKSTTLPFNQVLEPTLASIGMRSTIRVPRRVSEKIRKLAPYLIRSDIIRYEYYERNYMGAD
jgi:hypothetical protein